MIVIYCLIGFYFPCLITWASFVHIKLLFKTSPMVRCHSERQRAQQRALLRMCAVTSIILTSYSLPAQTIYVITAFCVTKNSQPLHHWGGVLVIFNSCVNPLIYWMTTREYRADLFKIFMFTKTVEPLRKGGYTVENKKCSRVFLPSQVKKDTLSLETMKCFE